MYLEFYNEECYYCKEKDEQCMKTLDEKSICPTCLVMQPFYTNKTIGEQK